MAVLSLQQRGTIRFVAYRDLEEGESVTISYLDSSEPNHVRRRMLRRTKLFTCRCALCFDPLEAGRGGSQLRCPACKKWQTPEEAPVGQKARRLGVTPKHLPETSAWLCAGCGARTPRAEVWALERSLRRALEEAETEARGARRGPPPRAPAPPFVSMREFPLVSPGRARGRRTARTGASPPAPRDPAAGAISPDLRRPPLMPP